MKKVLSILLAVALCFAFSAMAFAEEAAEINKEELSSIVDDIVGAVEDGDYEEIAGAVQVNADKLAAAFGDIVADADTVAADEAADYVITAISDLTGADMEDVREIVLDAIDEYGLSDVAIPESSEVAGLVDAVLMRLEENGIDTDPIIDTLASSKVGGAIIGIYTGEVVTDPDVVTTTETTTGDKETTTEEKSSDDVTDPTTGDDIDIPETGHASSVAAFAVLAVAAAGAYVCTRKKAE